MGRFNKTKGKTRAEARAAAKKQKAEEQLRAALKTMNEQFSLNNDDASREEHFNAAKDLMQRCMTNLDLLVPRALANFVAVRAGLFEYCNNNPSNNMMDYSPLSLATNEDLSPELRTTLLHKTGRYYFKRMKCSEDPIEQETNLQHSVTAFHQVIKLEGELGLNEDFSLAQIKIPNINKILAESFFILGCNYIEEARQNDHASKTETLETARDHLKRSLDIYKLTHSISTQIFDIHYNLGKALYHLAVAKQDTDDGLLTQAENHLREALEFYVRSSHTKNITRTLIYLKKISIALNDGENESPEKTIYGELLDEIEATQEVSSDFRGRFNEWKATQNAANKSQCIEGYATTAPALPLSDAEEVKGALPEVPGLLSSEISFPTEYASSDDELDWDSDLSLWNEARKISDDLTPTISPELSGPETEADGAWEELQRPDLDPEDDTDSEPDSSGWSPNKASAIGSPSVDTGWGAWFFGSSNAPSIAPAPELKNAGETTPLACDSSDLP
ncbi:MAG: hypothetical protein COA94_04075 [Rickettsiales bacterium]|nr:MAG: hypothetical protein COA94_04075 [Rickettsiales bacterium]